MKITLHVSFCGLAALIMLCQVAYAQQLPTGTIVLSKTNPNEYLLDAGFLPVKSELGQTWIRLSIPSVANKKLTQGLASVQGLLFNGHLRFLAAGSCWLENDGKWSLTDEKWPEGELVEHDGKIWVPTLQPPGVQYSSDGKEWTTETNNIPWAVELPANRQGATVINGVTNVIRWDNSYRPTLVSHQGSLLAVGRSAVWVYSEDGKWNCVSESPAWGDLKNPACVSFRGSILVMGGEEFIANCRNFLPSNIVWSSPDGREWTSLTRLPDNVERSTLRCIVAEGKLWILGGSRKFPFPSPSTIYFNDVWSSEDGVEWQQVTSHAAWEPRENANVIFHNNRLYLFGGSAERVPFGDIWASSPVRVNPDGFYYYEMLSGKE
jgi:hypothetical protein